MDNNGSEGCLLDSGFLRDVKPQPTTVCFHSDMGLFLVQHFNRVPVPSAQSPNVLSGTDYCECPEAGGWHSSFLHAGKLLGLKIRAGGRSNSLTCKGLFRTSSAEVWADNSHLTSHITQTSAALLPLLSSVKLPSCRSFALDPWNQPGVQSRMCSGMLEGCKCHRGLSALTCISPCCQLVSHLSCGS